MPQLIRSRAAASLALLAVAISPDNYAADLSKGHPPAVLDARVGPNTRVGNDPAALPATQRGQAEPHIIRSAANFNVLLAAFQEGRFPDAGALTCGYGVSQDGGFTWTRGLVPNLTTINGGRFLRATDPVCGAGPQGELYIQTLGSTQGAFDLAAVVVSRSLDGGVTWSNPATVFETTSLTVSPDKNWLAVNDFAGTPNAGRLVSTWTNFNSNAAGTTTSSPIVASVSDDRGATWSAPIQVTPVGFNNQGSQPMFLPDGTLAVVYITFLTSDTSTFNILCKRSLDGGRTFPAAATTVVPLVSGWDDPDIRDGVFLPSATVARTTGDLFVTYTAIVNGSPRVLVTKSTDSGATWTAPVVVSDQPASVSVMNPAVSVSPEGRVVSVVFMDKRNASDGHNFVDHYAACSLDGGTTWQPNVRLTEMSSDIRYAPQTSRGAMLGDYLGLAPSFAIDQPFVAIWCDSRSGDSDPYTVRFCPDAPGWQGWRIARFTKAELATGKTAPADDFDGDGVPNVVEFDEGTNPRVPEFGESLVVSRPNADTVNVAAAGRTNPGPNTAITAGEISTGVPAAGIALTRNDGVTPDVPLSSGLAWRTARFSGTTQKAISVVRGARTTGGVLGSRDSSVVPAILLVFESGTGETTASGTDSRLVNLSTRGAVKTGASQMIVGFVTEGGPKNILVRAIGPSLAGLGVTGALADPQLELIFGSLGQLQVFSVTNDDWSSSPGVNAALFARLGAFPLPAASKDSAIVQSLPPRAYTAVVSGVNNATGIGLVEAYDADAVPGAPANPRLLNLSARGEVGTGPNALIAGFVLTGTQPRRLLIRAIGPSLAQFGVTGVLPDPTLTLFQGNTVLATNDDWEISRSSAAIAATAQQVGAFPLGAASLDAALLITLSPGPYTVAVTGVDGATGIALVELYDVD